MMKQVLKRFLPLPAKKQNEMEARISKKLDAVMAQIKSLREEKRQPLLALPENEYPQKLKDWYFSVSGGKELNLSNPQTFCEKLNWLKLYDRNPMKSLLADKYLAPQYVRYVTGGRLKTLRCLGMWEDAFDIDFALLPERFVLKCNHGSSMNIIVSDKKKLNVAEAVKKLNGWLSTNYTVFSNCLELQYQDIKPRIIAEEFLDDGHPSLLDYKIHCFNGEPKMIQIIGSRNVETYSHKEIFLSTKWEKLDISKKDSTLLTEPMEKPKKLAEMLDFARFLSKDFLYVRMDFYYADDEIYFGEYTFSPAAGFLNFENPEADEELGKLLTLPASAEFNGGGYRCRVISEHFVPLAQKCAA